MEDLWPVSNLNSAALVSSFNCTSISLLIISTHLKVYGKSYNKSQTIYQFIAQLIGYHNIKLWVDSRGTRFKPAGYVLRYVGTKIRYFKRIKILIIQNILVFTALMRIICVRYVFSSIHVHLPFVLMVFK